MIEKEEQLDQILEQGSIAAPTPKEEIIYYRPKFHRRVLANFVDILIFIFILTGLFAATRAIVTNTDSFKGNFNELNRLRVTSGLYIDDNGQIKDVMSYLDGDSKNNTQYKMNQSRKAIEKFIAFASEVCTEKDYKTIVDDYDTYRLKSTMVYKNGDSQYNGTPLFVKDEQNVVVENPELFATGAYVPNVYGYFFSKAYKPYIDKNAQGYLATKIPNYYELSQYMALMLIFAEILPAYIMSGILVYYVPTLCFRRGRCTIGKALYRIGLVDSRVLSPTFARATARFSIFFFAELLLSIVTLGAPFLISFTMMLVTKSKQGFPDYMLKLTEIDMSRTKIYRSFDEVDLDKINAHKEPIDFRVPNFD